MKIIFVAAVLLMTVSIGDVWGEIGASAPSLRGEHCVYFDFPKGYPRVSVCGSEAFAFLAMDEARFYDDTLLKIVAQKPGEKAQTLFQGGEMFSGPRRFLALEGHKIQMTQELEISSGTNKRFYSLFKQDIVCQQKTCTLSQPACALNLPKDIYPNPNAVLAERLYIRALSGDAQAAKALNQLVSGESTDVSETISGYKSLYKTAKEICPKLP
jgi:hypothetical protein